MSNRTRPGRGFDGPLKFRSIRTHEDVPWLRAASEVLQIQDAANAANNIRVASAAQAVWNANMDHDMAPEAWAIVAQYARTLNDTGEQS